MTDLDHARQRLQEVWREEMFWSLHPPRPFCKRSSDDYVFTLGITAMIEEGTGPELTDEFRAWQLKMTRLGHSLDERWEEYKQAFRAYRRSRLVE